jgi:hypothetical protein
MTSARIVDEAWTNLPRETCVGVLGSFIFRKSSGLAFAAP